MHPKFVENGETSFVQRLFVLACACFMLAVIFVIVQSSKKPPHVAEIAPSAPPSSSPSSSAPFASSIASPIPADAWLNPISIADCPTAQLGQGFSSFHPGVDITGTTDCTVHAMRAGVVDAVDKTANDGLIITVTHDHDLHTSYSHGSGEAFVKVGQNVIAGEALMNMGQSGKATTVHLHFEISQAGQKLDPEKEMSFYPLVRK